MTYLPSAGTENSNLRSVAEATLAEVLPLALGAAVSVVVVAMEAPVEALRMLNLYLGVPFQAAMAYDKI